MKKSELIKIIKESITFNKKLKEVKYKVNHHNHLLEFFKISLNEDIVSDNASKDALSKILKNDFDTNPKKLL